MATPHPTDADFFDMSLDHLCVVDFEGQFLRVNPSWTRTLGWTAEELVGTPSIVLVHPEDREHTLLGRSRLHQGVSLGALRNRYRCRDGSYRWFEWRSVAGMARGVVYAAARDVTEQVLAEAQMTEARREQEQLQRQLMFAERMAMVGTLAAGSAHEINNPLTVVASNAAMLLEELRELGDVVPAARLAELTRMATEVRAGTERIATIVSGLKTFARAEEDRAGIVDLNQVVAVAVDLMTNEIQQRARLVVAYGAVPPVVASDARLGQVIIGLLLNAAQAIPEGASSDGHEVSVMTSTDPQGAAVVEVRDTGLGIPTEILHRVFDPFFTTKPIGTGAGLGLSICHNFVTAMGGTISVTSELDLGTTFRIVLPAAAPSRIAPAAPAPAKPEAPVWGKVLVVDDEVAIGGVLRRVLRGHEVTTTTSAREALALIESGQRFDVVLRRSHDAGDERHGAPRRADPAVPRGGGPDGVHLRWRLHRCHPRLPRRRRPPAAREAVRVPDRPGAGPALRGLTAVTPGGRADPHGGADPLVPFRAA